MSNIYATFRLHINKQYPELIQLYKIKIEEHNKQVLTDPHPNAGFDLHFPETTTFLSNNIDSKFVNFQIKGQMYFNDKITGYYIYPRSSISKTPLMFANSVGVVDSGYTGFLIGAFRNLNTFDNSNYTVNKNERLLQICHPQLHPIFIEWVEEEEDLVKTARGEKGFGSSGL
jgi:dUTP pyrophosphatase